jgi:membrane associated rhomboid family serine protease
VLPLKDENPVRGTAFVTMAIIAACLGIYFLWQPSLGQSDRVVVETPVGSVQIEETTAFNLEYAAIPCELTERRPLTLDETIITFGDPSSDGEHCGVGSSESPELFPDKSVWLSLLTSMFLHGSLLHLGGNLLFLWIFGNNIEDHLGHVRFAVFYLLSGVAAAALHVGLNLDSTVPIIGASGAIAGVMGAYLVWFPEAPVRTLVFLGFFITVIDIRAMWLLGFWFVSQFFTNPNSGVAWAAHVGGFVFGALVGLLVRSSGLVRRSAWTRDQRAVGRWAGAWDNTGGAGRRPYQSRRWTGW